MNFLKIIFNIPAGSKLLPFVNQMPNGPLQQQQQQPQQPQNNWGLHMGFQQQQQQAAQGADLFQQQNGQMKSGEFCNSTFLIFLIMDRSN
jgi:hypothetical protein